jgi:hypothetical protein
MQLDPFSQNSRESRNEYGHMQLYDCFLNQRQCSANEVCRQKSGNSMTYT